MKANPPGSRFCNECGSRLNERSKIEIGEKEGD